MGAEIPPDEDARLAALFETGLLDTPPEERFDDLARLAQLICETPMALVSLVDRERQWFKARCGLEPTETPREHAFCAHAILGDDILEVEDARQDPRFADNPLVTGPPHIRFYAGAPLRLPSGEALGTLCVLDERPRRLTGDQRMALARLARQVVELVVAGTPEKRPTRLLGRFETFETYRALFEAAPVLVVVANLEGWFLHVNDRWEQLLGYTPRELLGRPFLDFVHPADREATRLELSVLAAGREGSGYRNRYRHANGSWRWLTWHAILDRGGLIYAVAFDSTALSELTERLAASQDRLARTARMARVGGWDIDLVHRRLHWSEETYRIHEADPGWEPSFDDALRFYPPEARSVVVETLRDAIAGRASFDFEVPFETARGERRWVRASGEPRFDLGGKVVAFHGMLMDVSEQKEAELAKDRLLSTVSHELRTPLTSVFGALRLLQSGKLGELDARGRQMVEVAIRNAQRLSRLVDDLLDIGRTGAGQLAIRPERADLAELVREAGSSVAEAARSVGVRLTLELPDAPLWATADPTRIVQVLMNLLGNAIKFSPEGSEVVAVVEPRGEMATVTVIDEGPGLPAEAIPRVFDRFLQLPAGRAQGGFGLGLPISKAIVEAHGGRIGIESEEGHGARAWFELPLAGA
ncbi:MAG TPA: PAS domain S-box protein [Polyangiaceae bacterium LLY-WYZ-15_(1-7)]|nr:PAS domain S-box protein [Polyangiaceae bacterium LLY-WYZ-15_(1-7)]